MTTSRKRFFVDQLAVQVHNSRKELGLAAAELLTQKITSMLERQQRLNMIFAAAPSQNEFLDALVAQKGIDWGHIHAFHMDEYIGIAPEASQRFGHWLKVRLFDRLPFGSVHYINPANPDKECVQYAQLLQKNPPDIVCLGIGENGHLAFNDPPVADFEDPYLVKVVELEEACRQQQVNDGCFASLSDVPKKAITLTIPALMAAKHLCCVVPGSNKAEAVRRTLEGEISTECPASILRTHQDATLYLDDQSYARVESSL